MAGKDRHFWYIYSALILLVLIRIIPFLYAGSRTWGFNHLIFLPIGFSIAFFSIAGIALILPLIKKSKVWGEGFIDRFSSVFFESPRWYLHRIIFIFCMGALFVIFTGPTHFLGDGYAILKNITSDKNTLYKWSEIGIILLLEKLQLIFGSAVGKSSASVIQGVSVLSGMISIWLFFAIAQIVSADKTRRIFIFAASMLSGSLLLWFGYIEHYPILWVFMLAVIYYSIKYTKTGHGLVAAWLFLLIGVALHLQLAVFIPGVLFITLFSDRSRDDGSNVIKFIWRLAIVFIAAVIGIFIYKYFTDIYFRAMFIDISSSSLVDSDYSLFSIEHILDILNQSLLLSPLLLAYITIFKVRGLLLKDKFATIFLIIASVGSLTFLLLVDPKLGMARDWDLFSLTLYPITLFFLFKSNAELLPLLKRFTLTILLLLIVSPVPYLLTNLKRETSISYVESLISLDTSRSLSALFILYSYHQNRGDAARADSLEQMYKFSLPRRNKCDSVVKALKYGDVNTAAAILSRIEPNEYDGYYQSIVSRFYYLRGDLDQAMEHIEKAIQLGRYYSNYYGDRARIYIARGDYTRALEDLRYGYSLDNSSKYVIDGLANIYFIMRDPDSTIFYAQRRLSIDSTSGDFYYMLAKSYLIKNDLERAKAYTNRLADFISQNQKFRKYLNELTEEIQKAENR